MNFFFLCISSLASAGWTLLFVISLILRKPLIKKFWVYLKDLEKRAHEAKENKETMKNIFYHGFVYFCYSPIAFVLLLWLLAYGERA